MQGDGVGEKEKTKVTGMHNFIQWILGSVWMPSILAMDLVFCVGMMKLVWHQNSMIAIVTGMVGFGGTMLLIPLKVSSDLLSGSL